LFSVFFLAMLQGMDNLLAQDPQLDPGNTTGQTNFWGDCLKEGAATLSCVPYLFQNLITAAFTLAGSIAVLLIIWSGVKFLLSHGDPKKVEEARTVITYAIVGLVLVLLSGFILSTLSYVLSIPCIRMVGFDTCK